MCQLALELELTETFLIQDSKSVVAVLRALRDMGVQLALDDFGTLITEVVIVTAAVSAIARLFNVVTVAVGGMPPVVDRVIEALAIRVPVIVDPLPITGETHIERARALGRLEHPDSVCIATRGGSPRTASAAGKPYRKAE